MQSATQSSPREEDTSIIAVSSILSMSQNEVGLVLNGEQKIISTESLWEAKHWWQVESYMQLLWKKLGGDTKMG